MTIGTVTGIPNNTFAFPRSYIQRLFFAARLGAPIVGGANFVFKETLFPQNTYYINIAANFWNWSSNKWTLDHIVAEAYATIDPSPVLIPASVFVTYKPPVDAYGSKLLVDVFIVEGSYSQVTFPPRDQPYWLPDL